MPSLRLLCCLLPSLVLVAGAPVPVAAGDAPPVWERPVDGPVVRPFSEGSGRFGIGGHAGADLAAAPGDPVRVAGEGVVAFTGTVAGDRFVVVAHGGGLRTTYGYLAEISVRRGQRVVRGQVVGRLGAEGGDGHGPGVLHFGLREGGRYLDPMALFGPPDLTAMVRLVPVDDPGAARLLPVAGERRALLAELRRGRGALARLAEALGGAAGVGPGSARVLARAVRARLHLQVALGRMVVMGALGTARQVEGMRAAAFLLLWEAGMGGRDWWRHRGRCSRRSVAASASARPGRHVMAVGGVNSRTRPDGSTFALPVGELGYEPGEAHWFSYEPGGGPYRRHHSHVGPVRAAALLAEQLRRFRAEHPGTPVDLVGHSQGGVVVETFLKHHYSADPSAYPPLGEVVTLAAPHGGARLATEAAELAAVPGLRRAVDGLAVRAGQPRLSSGAATDLAEGSAVLRDLRRTPLPPGVSMTTIGALDDFLVTADRTRVRGARHVVVNPSGWSDHSGVVDDPAAVGATKLALAGLPPPCTSLPGAIRRRVEPLVIREALSLTDQLVTGPLV